MPKTIKIHSSSVKSVAAASEVGLKSGDGEALTAGQISHSRKVSISKVVGHKSLGSTPRFPPPISKKMGVGGGGKVDTTMKHTIRKPACFSQQDSLTPIHLLGSSGPGDCGKAAPIAVQQKWVRVWSLSPMDLNDLNLDSATNEVSLGDNLNETDRSQPTPYNSHETSPVSQASHHHDDSVVGLEASQDELDELDRDESTKLSLQSSQDSHVLKSQLHEK